MNLPRREPGLRGDLGCVLLGNTQLLSRAGMWWQPRQLPPPDPAWTTASQSRAASEELVSLDPPQCPQTHKTRKLGSMGGHGLWNLASRHWIPTSTCETSCESNDLTSLYTISLPVKWR